MRLLLRANAHRILDQTSVEIAASPDTPHRERWQWHVRLHAGQARLTKDALTRSVVLDNGSTETLEVAADRRHVDPRVDVLDVRAQAELSRGEHELLVLVVIGGAALIEGRHLLTPRDALVLQGDDPLRVGIAAAAGSVSAGVVRLVPVRDRVLAWVP